jgi:hypothetical protein
MAAATSNQLNAQLNLFGLYAETTVTATAAPVRLALANGMSSRLAL